MYNILMIFDYDSFFKYYLVSMKRRDDKMTKYILNLTKEMTNEEMISLAKESGAEMIYIMGEEPLKREGFVDAVKEISSFADVKAETDGQLLEGFAKDLKEAGLKQIVVKADTMKYSRFAMDIDLGPEETLGNVIKGINAATDAGLKPVRLKVRFSKDYNEDEVLNYVQLTYQHEYEILMIGSESFPEENIRKKLPAYVKAKDDEYDVEWGKYPGASGRICFEK